MARLVKLLLFLCLLVLPSIYTLDSSNDTSDFEVEGKSEILSRRKRFLVFPEGSSIQLVFCLTYPTIFAIGDIFLWGYTAALAYELPQDPYSPFMHHADPLHRRIDTKTIYYTDEVGKVLFKQPYKRKPIINPAFAKRSVDDVSAMRTKKESLDKFKIDRTQMHASKNGREFLKRERMDGQSSEFHRSSRVALYRKIETLFRGLGSNGRHCLLKTLCLVRQTQHQPQGTFFQEILRATFTMPEGQSKISQQMEYDLSYDINESCDELYPECDKALSDPTSPTFSY